MHPNRDFVHCKNTTRTTTMQPFYGASGAGGGDSAMASWLPAPSTR